MTDDNDILFPLGYCTSSELIRTYGYRHGLQRTKASMIVGETSEEEIVDEATAIIPADLQEVCHVFKISIDDRNTICSKPGDNTAYASLLSFNSACAAFMPSNSPCCSPKP
jgi:hypothetical protein